MKSFPSNAKIGLEVHMQLNVGKLFCACPEEGTPTGYTFTRKLHSLTGESGTTDVSAMYEDSRDRTFRYVATTNSCLVEADDEPPHSPNRKAVEIALAVSMALKASILEDMTVMRKVVIDGSNTGGFQRTAIVSMGGAISSEECRAGIMALSLEEDSCRRIGENNGFTEFSLDRLGIPLIEISTEPDMKTPEEAISIARAIGNLTLVPGYLRKGADAIRQDVNFSMGHGRVEIKGVSRLNFIKDVLEKEVERQSKLSDAMNILKERGGFREINFQEITEKMKLSNSKIVKSGIDQGKSVFIGRAENLGGLMKKDGFTLGREVADSLKLMGIKGILHNDELPAYGISQEDVNNFVKLVEMGRKDSFIMIICYKDQIEEANRNISKRIEKFLSLDFSETRAAMADGTTRFMRPLSGSSRMYPETDIPIFHMDSNLLSAAGDMIPKPIEVASKEVSTDYGISIQDARVIILSGKLDLLKITGNHENGKVLARLFTQTIPEAERKYGKEMDEVKLKTLIKYCSENNLGRYSMERGIEELLQEKTMDNIISERSLLPIDSKAIMSFIEENNLENEKNVGTVVEKISSALKGVVNPGEVAALLKNKKNKGSN